MPNEWEELAEPWRHLELKTVAAAERLRDAGLTPEMGLGNRIEVGRKQKHTIATLYENGTLTLQQVLDMVNPSVM